MSNSDILQGITSIILIFSPIYGVSILHIFLIDLLRGCTLALPSHFDRHLLDTPHAEIIFQEKLSWMNQQ